MKANKTCSICGVKYAYCPTCVQDMNKPVWMNLFHSQECKDIYDICSQFETGKISAGDANAKLANLDLSKVVSNSAKASIAKIKSNGGQKAEKVEEKSDDKSEKNEKFDKFEKKDKKFHNNQNVQDKAEDKKEDTSESVKAQD